MKRLALTILLVTSIAHAQERVSLVFDRIPLMDLARIAYGEIGRQPVVLTPQALEVSEQVSVDLKDISAGQAIAQAEELLERAGYRVEQRDKVTWIDRRSQEVGELFYRPRFRSVAYLVDLLSPVFQAEAFTVQRGVKSPDNQPAPQTQSDAGGSAFSLIDKNPDAFIFRGDAKAQGRLRKLLAQIDTPTPELLVKAVIYEVSTDQTEKSALSLALSVLGGKLQIGRAVAGDFSAVVKLASIDAVLDVLATDSRFKVVSSPHLRVKSGEKARLTVGTETPILGSAQVDRNGNPVQSVEYRPSGVILDLRPEIRGDVSDLRINQQISNFIPTTNGVNNSPTLIKRELMTSVGVKSDDVLVLGGLDEDKRTEDRKGMPCLPDWLGSSGKSESKTEVLLILQATRI